jgi:hypothetical protein
MSGVIELGVLGLCWLTITVAMLLLYLLVIGPGLESMRDAVFRALRSDATYDDMHASDIALGVTGIVLVVGIGPLIVLAQLGFIGGAL